LEALFYGHVATAGATAYWKTLRAVGTSGLLTREGIAVTALLALVCAAAAIWTALKIPAAARAVDEWRLLRNQRLW
jgi:hypothetical protein